MDDLTNLVRRRSRTLGEAKKATKIPVCLFCPRSLLSLTCTVRCRSCSDGLHGRTRGERIGERRRYRVVRLSFLSRMLSGLTYSIGIPGTTTL
jgi:hypothetical protein